jgi:hypothetical protein
VKGRRVQSAFLPLAQRNAFRRRDARQQSGSFADWDQSLRRTSVCRTGRLISTYALTFWICDACSFRFAARASISFCFSAAVIFCLGTVDLGCEKVASLIRPSGF